MKILMVAMLMLSNLGWAKDVKYDLTAKIVSSEETSTYVPEITRSVGQDREEIRVGDTLYITSLWGRGNVGKLGESFPAALGKKHGLPVLYLLIDGKCVTFEITGQHLEGTGK